MSEHTYSIGLSFLFWLLWVVGLLVLLLFGFFLLVTVVDAPVMGVWNGLVVLAEIFLLFKTARHFVRKDLPLSKLLLWIALAAVGFPLVAFGGCLILDDLRFGLRFAG